MIATVTRWALRRNGPNAEDVTRELATSAEQVEQVELGAGGTLILRGSHRERVSMFAPGEWLHCSTEPDAGRQI